MRIKLFENFEKPLISWTEAQDWIVENYPEYQVCNMFDDEILNWVDSDWEDEHESEYDWYIDYGNGEAEAVVRDQIISDLKDKFELAFNPEGEGTNLAEYLGEVFDCLNKF